MGVSLLFGLPNPGELTPAAFSGPNEFTQKPYTTPSSNPAVQAITRICPQTVGQQVDAAAKHADKAVADAIGRTKDLANREILEVLDGERLQFFGIGRASCRERV